MKLKYTVPFLATALIFLSGCAAFPLLDFIQPFVLSPDSLSVIRVGPESANLELLKFNWPGGVEELPSVEDVIRPELLVPGD